LHGSSGWAACHFCTWNRWVKFLLNLELQPDQPVCNSSVCLLKCCGSQICWHSNKFLWKFTEQWWTMRKVSLIMCVWSF
jgi:hypothetical protein